jgi:hypothetical protein
MSASNPLIVCFLCEEKTVSKIVRKIENLQIEVINWFVAFKTCIRYLKIINKYLNP